MDRLRTAGLTGKKPHASHDLQQLRPFARRLRPRSGGAQRCRKGVGLCGLGRSMSVSIFSTAASASSLEIWCHTLKQRTANESVEDGTCPPLAVPHLCTIFKLPQCYLRSLKTFQARLNVPPSASASERTVGVREQAAQQTRRKAFGCNDTVVSGVTTLRSIRCLDCGNAWHLRGPLVLLALVKWAFCALILVSVAACLGRNP